MPVTSSQTVNEAGGRQKFAISLATLIARKKYITVKEEKHRAIPIPPNTNAIWYALDCPPCYIYSKHPGFSCRGLFT